MAEELNNLIERIQKDGIDKAKSEAESIIANAKKQAEESIKSGEQRARTLLKQAEEEAIKHVERSDKAISQAARDVIISVGRGVEKLLNGLLSESVAEVLTPEQLAQMLTALAKSYAEHGMAENRITALVSPEDQEQLTKLCAEKYKETLGKGVKISSDDDITKGFKVSFKEGKVQHDFTLDAIADAMSEFLQPQLEKIVREAVKKPIE